MGGALLSGAYSNVAFGGPGSFFIVDISLSLVAMVVIGGMGSVTAAVIGAIWVIGIPALAPNNQVLGLLTSSIGLLAVLLYFPRGLMQVAYDAVMHSLTGPTGDSARMSSRRRRRRPPRPPCRSPNTARLAYRPWLSPISG